MQITPYPGNQPLLQREQTRQLIETKLQSMVPDALDAIKKAGGYSGESRTAMAGYGNAILANYLEATAPQRVMNTLA